MPEHRIGQSRKYASAGRASFGGGASAGDGGASGRIRAGFGADLRPVLRLVFPFAGVSSCGPVGWWRVLAGIRDHKM